jgi:hypothetical protein
MIAPDLRDELDRKLNQTRDLGTTTSGIASADEFKRHERLEVVSSNVEPMGVKTTQQPKPNAPTDGHVAGRGVNPAVWSGH